MPLFAFGIDLYDFHAGALLQIGILLGYMAIIGINNIIRGIISAMEINIIRKTPHLGWSEEEDAILFKEIEKARSQGRALKSVFENVAFETGRKPNSIRNYYYSKVKEAAKENRSMFHCAAFVPFNDDEVKELLKTVLSKQASGVSVRACTLEMGNGDMKAMLRYQNKYRSLIKNEPELVLSVVKELEQQGISAHNPYNVKAREKSKNNENLIEVVSNVVNDLDNIEGLDVVSFFEALGTLAINANKGMLAQKKLEAMHTSDITDSLILKENIAELKEQLHIREEELKAQKNRFEQLMEMFKQLVSVNKEFLDMTGISKMSSLSSYVKELSKSVELCDKHKELTAE